MPNDGINILVEWLAALDNKLELIHAEISAKPNRSELEAVEEKVDSANKKINYFSGALALLMSFITAGLGFFKE